MVPLCTALVSPGAAGASVEFIPRPLDGVSARAAAAAGSTAWDAAGMLLCVVRCRLSWSAHPLLAAQRIASAAGTEAMADEAEAEPLRQTTANNTDRRIDPKLTREQASLHLLCWLSAPLSSSNHARSPLDLE